jgi:hypothetical protein
MAKREHSWRPIPNREMARGKYLGTLEFQSQDGEWHIFEIVNTPRCLVFGGATNVGLLQSGYMMKDNYFSLDENLQELYADLEVYYNDGPRYVSRIICNNRM